MRHIAIVCSGLLTAMLADVPTDDDVRAYQAAATALGRDAGAHVRLASWCEVHGLNAERHKHLALALEIEPDNVAAHGLLGQVADNGEWRMPVVIAEEHRDDKAASATLALYHARRAKIPETVQAHRQLAEWCDENGLKAEAITHWTAVARLNPAQEEAWKKLGYRKQKGRWTAPDHVAAQRAATESAQHRADAKWRPLLEKWNGWMDHKARRADAEAAMAGVHDPLAVPSIWKVFIVGKAGAQERAVRLLGQIDAPSASRALAFLAVLGASDKVRHAAAVSLLGRDPREFALSLIGLLRDPIAYEVRNVDGPGKPGELYIHGERANTRFYYAAPPPLTTFRPTDVVGYDYDGMPVANRVVGYAYEPVAAMLDPLLQGAPDLTGAPQALAKAGLGQFGMQLGAQMMQNQQMNTQIGAEVGKGARVLMPLTAQVPVGRLMVQAQQQAANSRARLQQDVAALDRYNNDVNQVNERVTTALNIALRKETGPQRKAWLKWWTGLMETVTAAAPVSREGGPESSPAAVDQRAMIPAFGAETPVLTHSGSQPIAAIRAGDLVLTQDTATGALAFTPVLTIRHGDRQVAKTISIGDSSIVATELERFWVAGKGWSMVLDLKAGDAIRALGNIVQVAAIDDAGVWPVYHVSVAAGRGILVGQRGILAHDERVAIPAAVKFDAVATVGAAQPGH